MSTLQVTGLQPDDGKQWCAACVMLAKQALHEKHLPDMIAALKDGKNGIVRFHVTPDLLQHAITIAVWGDAPNMPPMPVCWTHAAGINLKAKSPLEVPNGAIPLPKGLIKGQG
jgi:hypothetical protein